MNHLRTAEIVDAYRVVPRAVLAGYAYLVYYVSNWYMGMDDPTTQQAAFVSTVIGASAAVIGLYNNSGRNFSKGDTHEPL